MSLASDGQRISRISLYIAFSSLVCLVRLRSAEETEAESFKCAKSIVQKMIPLIEILGLTNKSAEEVQRETFVDFSILPPTIPVDERMRAKVLLSLYTHRIHPENIRETAETLHPSDQNKYELYKYNNGIVALGVENFISAATQFCEDEAAAGGAEIVSIGSGDGTIERDIIDEYRTRFGKNISIKLVDPNPLFDGVVDFKTVDQLIAQRPSTVGNCVAFIIWPDSVGKEIMSTNASEAYDIEAVRKLQPKAAFVVYECTGGSGSNDFRAFLRDDNLETLSRHEIGVQNWMAQFNYAKKETYGLDNYSIGEIAHQKIRLNRSGTFILRMVKLKRMDGTVTLSGLPSASPTPLTGSH